MSSGPHPAPPRSYLESGQKGSCFTYSRITLFSLGRSRRRNLPFRGIFCYEKERGGEERRDFFCPIKVNIRRNKIVPPPWGLLFHAVCFPPSPLELGGREVSFQTTSSPKGKGISSNPPGVRILLFLPCCAAYHRFKPEGSGAGEGGNIF